MYEYTVYKCVYVCVYSVYRVDVYCAGPMQTSVIIILYTE